MGCEHRHHDEVLVGLDAEVAALTRQCLRAWKDAVAARRRGDWDEVERLQDLADTLSDAADNAQRRLDAEVRERVASTSNVLVLTRGRYARR